MFSQMAELTFFQGDYLSGFSHHNKSPAGKENVNLRNLIPMEYLAGQTWEPQAIETGQESANT